MKVSLVYGPGHGLILELDVLPERYRHPFIAEYVDGRPITRVAQYDRVRIKVNGGEKAIYIYSGSKEWE